MKELVLDIVGLPNAGKGAVIGYLQEEHGFGVVSISDTLRAIARERFGNTQREFLRRVRGEVGDTYIADEAIQRVRFLPESRVVVDAIRQVELQRRLVEEFGEGFKILGVEADLRVRYGRALRRLEEQGRVESGELSLSDFISTDLIESGIRPDDSGQKYDTQIILRNADVVVRNNSDHHELRRLLSYVWNVRLDPQSI